MVEIEDVITYEIDVYSSDLETLEKYLKTKGISISLDDWSYFSYVKRLHPNILWFCEEDNDYQGEWYMVGEHKQTGFFYFQQGSFGSCGGCDWLESIRGTTHKKTILEFLKDMGKIMKIGINRIQAIQYLKGTKHNTYWSQDTIDKLIKRLEEWNLTGLS